MQGAKMDLFDYMREQNMEKESPLAARLRPTTLDEVVGQEHIIGKDKLLYRAIKADKLSSILFYGPPGTGKTTLAKVIANTTSAEFLQMNATSAGKKDMEEVVQQAKNNQGMYGKKTILFIDEIHRFNKGQQDYLLPFVEDGTIILIGATTENPYFEVNGALLSRSIIFELHALEKEDIKKLLVRAVTDKEKGMGVYQAVIDEDALEFMADVANGDARAALTAIELGILTTPRSEDGLIHITIDVCIYQKYPWNRPGCSPLLPRKNVICRRRYPFHRKKNHDQRGRGCWYSRPDGIECSGFCSTGSRTYRYAGGTDYSCRSSCLCGKCPKE